MSGGFVLDREMGCSRREFMNWLPGATRHAPVRIEDGDVVLTVGDGHVRISLREEPPRRIALISLPVLSVQFRFDGLGASERAAFLAYFDFYTRRGGG